MEIDTYKNAKRIIRHMICTDYTDFQNFWRESSFRNELCMLLKDYEKAKEAFEEFIKLCKEKMLDILDAPKFIKQCNDAINSDLKSMYKKMLSTCKHVLVHVNIC